jgi:DNA repair protein RadC
MLRIFRESEKASSFRLSIDATDRMIQVGRILDIHVIDHLIISERAFCDYYSFENYGVMEQLRKSVKYIPSLEVKQQFQKRFGIVQELFKQKLKLTKKESKEIGRKEGEKLGILKGSIQIAKEMLKEHESIEKIVRYTGLSKEEIQKITL